MIGRRSTRAMPDPAEAQARFRALILPHLDAAYSLARYLAGDAAVAEDVTQEAYLRAFRLFATYQGGSARAWLFAILRNCWRDRAGDEARRRRLVVTEAHWSEAQAAAVANVPADGEHTPDAAAERRDDAETLRAAIAQLPEPFREALVLREIEDMSYREIAQITQAPLGTVMSRLARAREQLAELLAPADPALTDRQESRA
jgi:RNA polymerase sigma-70 factor (ECF subfamily)